MTEKNLHPGLEMRLAALAERIGNLRQGATQESGLDRINDLGEIEQLERRHKLLSDELQALNAEGPGHWQNVKAEIEKRIDDVAGTVEEFIIRLDRATSKNGSHSE